LLGETVGAYGVLTVLAKASPVKDGS